MSRSRSLLRTCRVPALVAAAAVLTLTASAGAVASGAAQTAEEDFPRPLATNSTFFPLRPGTQYHYRGTIVDEEGVHRHQVDFTVTDLVKSIDGINARVILDEDIIDGELAEAELAFFAQDAHDNVWTRGEYPEEYENGSFAGAPSTWITGQRGAQAGILVPGHPRTGTPPFVQGYAPAIDFYDVGQVVASGLRVCVTAGCYSGVVKIKETAPNEPADGFQFKYYAPNVGPIKITASGGSSQETLELASVDHLGASAMAKVTNTALRLEARAYRISAVYRATGPAHPQH